MPAVVANKAGLLHMYIEISTEGLAASHSLQWHDSQAPASFLSHTYSLCHSTQGQPTATEPMPRCMSATRCANRNCC